MKQLQEEVLMLRDNLKKQDSLFQFANYQAQNSGTLQEEDRKGLFGKNKDKEKGGAGKKKESAAKNVNENHLEAVKDKHSGQTMLKHELSIKKTYNGKGFTDVLSPAKNAIVNSSVTLVLKDKLKENAVLTLETKAEDKGKFYSATVRANNNRHTISLSPRSKFPKGLYYWSLKSGEGKLTGKFYVE